MQLLHTMLRVGDLQRSIDFYTKIIGMELLRTTERPEQKYSLAFVAFDGGNKNGEAEIELTYNHGVSDYDIGTAYGHIALGVESVAADLQSHPRGRRQHHPRARPGEGRQDRHRLRRGPGRLQDRAHRDRLARDLSRLKRATGRRYHARVGTGIRVWLPRRWRQSRCRPCRSFARERQRKSMP